MIKRYNGKKKGRKDRRLKEGMKEEIEGWRKRIEG